MLLEKFDSILNKIVLPKTFDREKNKNYKKKKIFKNITALFVPIYDISTTLKRINNNDRIFNFGIQFVFFPTIIKTRKQQNSAVNFHLKVGNLILLLDYGSGVDLSFFHGEY